MRGCQFWIVAVVAVVFVVVVSAVVVVVVVAASASASARHSHHHPTGPPSLPHIHIHPHHHTRITPSPLPLAAVPLFPAVPAPLDLPQVVAPPRRYGSCFYSSDPLDGDCVANCSMTGTRRWKWCRRVGGGGGEGVFGCGPGRGRRRRCRSTSWISAREGDWGCWGSFCSCFCPCRCLSGSSVSNGYSEDTSRRHGQR